MKSITGGLLVAVFLIGILSDASAHCQVPCGIYDDPVRFIMMNEHVATIEKSMKQVAVLSGQPQPNHNQIVRWVQNKDKHADELAEIATYYFMAQRIKPVDPESKEAYTKYIKELTLLHEIVVYAMKAKQSTDTEVTKQLYDRIRRLKASYLGEEAGMHPHPHPHPH